YHHGGNLLHGSERSRASASPAVTICTLPERWRGAPAVPDTRGHLRSSAPGQHYGNGVTGCDKNVNLVILRMRKIESANPLKIALIKW
ncbi:TPA: hypothetical protein QHX39_004775, partial [Enterobacter ludwigii]|nr:hypothetical protein [Enterobacter ludwigii]